MQRDLSLLHFSTIIGIGVLCLCIVPMPHTPTSSIDIANTLTSFPWTSPGLRKNLHDSTPAHSNETLAALTIYLEARGESFAGKMAVAAVIRNRMLHKYHSDGTVKGTVLRAKQFEPWMRRSPEEVLFDPGNPKMQDSLLAWTLVQDGRDVVGGAVLFYNPSLVNAPRWAQVNRKVAKIGDHEFFNKHHI